MALLIPLIVMAVIFGGVEELINLSLAYPVKRKTQLFSAIILPEAAEREEKSCEVKSWSPIQLLKNGLRLFRAQQKL